MKYKQVTIQESEMPTMFIGGVKYYHLANFQCAKCLAICPGFQRQKDGSFITEVCDHPLNEEVKK